MLPHLGFDRNSHSKLSMVVLRFLSAGLSSRSIQALVAALKDQFASVQNMPKLNRPLPLVLSGGSVMVPGLCDCF
jgi:hypothetical protein